MFKRIAIFISCGVLFCFVTCTTSLKTIEEGDYSLRKDKAYIFCVLYNDFFTSTHIILKNADTDALYDINSFDNSSRIKLLELEPGSYYFFTIFQSTFGNSYTYELDEDLRWPFDISTEEVIYLGEYYAKDKLVISFSQFEQSKAELLSKYKRIDINKIKLLEM
jgi:hypothetical protein